MVVSYMIPYMLSRGLSKKRIRKTEYHIPLVVFARWPSGPTGPVGAAGASATAVIKAISAKGRRPAAANILLCVEWALCLRPLQNWPLFRIRTIPQVQVDKILVRNPCLQRQLLEVLDDINAKSDGDLLLEFLGEWVLAPLHLREIIFLSHVSLPLRS